MSKITGSDSNTNDKRQANAVPFSMDNNVLYACPCIPHSHLHIGSRDHITSTYDGLSGLLQHHIYVYTIYNT